MNCEYCGRAESTAKTCEGCGAPSNHIRPAIMYDPRVLNKEDVRYLGIPGRNISINLPSPRGARFSDVIVFKQQVVEKLVRDFYGRNS